RVLSRGEQLLDIRGHRTPFLFHARDRCLDACRIPQFEWPQFPVETETHGTVDFNDAAGNFRDAVCGICPQLGERGPQELLVLALARAADQALQSCARVLDVLRHLERRELWLLA